MINNFPVQQLYCFNQFLTKLQLIINQLKLSQRRHYLELTMKGQIQKLTITYKKYSFQMKKEGQNKQHEQVQNKSGERANNSIDLSILSQDRPKDEIFVYLKAWDLKNEQKRLNILNKLNSDYMDGRMDFQEYQNVLKVHKRSQFLDKKLEEIKKKVKYNSKTIKDVKSELEKYDNQPNKKARKTLQSIRKQFDMDMGTINKIRRKMKISKSSNNKDEDEDSSLEVSHDSA